ncbi:MAG TPA: AAA family ATPase [Acidobacteriota bacterium]|nr:AAA family ATPase [Acidobacteriota bacterium]HRV09137.1 AAA family ATPase [Acidobacteriota bacterium]
MSLRADETGREMLSRVEALRTAQQRILEQLRRAVVGQDEIIEQVLIAIFVGGHCLITGLPGLAKTLLVRSLAQSLGLDFKRIQFTPDLMPADITGTEIIEEDRSSGHRRLQFVPGPIFTNLLLADEINRTPPKTQAALLEAMQERSVTVAGRTMPLQAPFFVLATQNPIELEGTYPLPEAQLDRFMLNILIDYLPEDEEVEVVQRTTARQEITLETVVTGAEVIEGQLLVRDVPVPEDVMTYAVRLVRATRPSDAGAPDFVRRWVSYGASVRAAQYLILGGKARALLHDRYNVAVEDIQALAHPVLRHRILTNFHAESEGVRSDQITDQLLEAVPVPAPKW